MLRKVLFLNGFVTERVLSGVFLVRPYPTPFLSLFAVFFVTFSVFLSLLVCYYGLLLFLFAVGLGSSLLCRSSSRRSCSCRYCTRQVALDRFLLAPSSPIDSLFDKLMALTRNDLFLQFSDLPSWLLLPGPFYPSPSDYVFILLSISISVEMYYDFFELNSFPWFFVLLPLHSYYHCTLHF